MKTAKETNGESLYRSVNCVSCVASTGKMRGKLPARGWRLCEKCSETSGELDPFVVGRKIAAVVSESLQI